MEKVFVTGTFVYKLFVLEFVRWMDHRVPIVLIAPDTIISDMIVIRKVLEIYVIGFILY